MNVLYFADLCSRPCHGSFSSDQSCISCFYGLLPKIVSLQESCKFQAPTKGESNHVLYFGARCGTVIHALQFWPYRKKTLEVKFKLTMSHCHTRQRANFNELNNREKHRCQSQTERICFSL